MLLKDLYSPTFFNHFSLQLKAVLPQTHVDDFLSQIYTTDWEEKALKDRMRHIAEVLTAFLPNTFENAAEVILQLVNNIQKTPFTQSGFEFMFFPEYIEKNGLTDVETSTYVMERITPYTSCEFAVRPFIVKYEEAMLKQLLTWSLHHNHHVRRLASEGSRPRLPWAIALPKFKKDPTPIFPVLENLKQDSSEYVRRSVANHLNDVAKDNPDLVVKIAQQWQNLGKETDALIKHACRTLLKQGHPEILAYYNLDDSPITVADFKVLSPEVTIGNALDFSFTLHNPTETPQKIRIEYAIYYLRSQNQYSKKVFKLSERVLQPLETLNLVKKHSTIKKNETL